MCSSLGMGAVLLLVLVSSSALVSSNSGPNNQIDQVLTILIKKSVLQMIFSGTFLDLNGTSD